MGNCKRPVCLCVYLSVCVNARLLKCFSFFSFPLALTTLPSRNFEDTVQGNETYFIKSFVDTNEALTPWCFTAAAKDTESRGGDVLRIQHHSAALPLPSPALTSISRGRAKHSAEISLDSSWKHLTEWGPRNLPKWFSSSVVSIFSYSFSCSPRVSLLCLSLIISIIIFSICAERWRHKVRPGQREQLQASIPIYYSTPNPHIFPLCGAHHRVHWTPITLISFYSTWLVPHLHLRGGEEDGLPMQFQPKQAHVPFQMCCEMFVYAVYADLWRAYLTASNQIMSLHPRIISPESDGKKKLKNIHLSWRGSFRINNRKQKQVNKFE